MHISRQRLRPFAPDDDETAGGSTSKNRIKVLIKSIFNDLITAPTT